MGIGLRRQIKLVQIVVTQDTDGRNKEAEGDKFGVWAEIKQKGGFRDYNLGQTQLGTTKEFLIRFRFNKYPNVNWKIVYQDHDWTISDINNVKEKRFYWSITATMKADA